jgi:hypothetical protein
VVQKTKKEQSSKTKPAKKTAAKRKPAKKTVAKRSPATPEEAKAIFLKKFPSIKQTEGVMMKKKFYDKGNLLPECVNKGCKSAITVREWKNQSIKSECTRCARCRKNGELIPGVTIHKKKFCQNKDGLLGFECPMKSAIWDEWLESLHLDHKDGFHEHNWPGNVETICNLCHTRKSKKRKDWDSNKPSGRKLE